MHSAPVQEQASATTDSLPTSTRQAIERSPGYSTERLGALSDGVFAIALTLLVLDLKIPELPEQFAERQMWHALQGQLPNALAWLSSFVLLSRFWVAHHRIVAGLARCHTNTLVYNFIVLGLVSLVPFAASLIGRYELDPLALSIFSATMAATGFAVGGLARHAASSAPQQPAEVRPHTSTSTWRYHCIVLPGFALASIGLLAVHEVIALTVWLLEPAVALATRLARRKNSPG